MRRYVFGRLGQVILTLLIYVTLVYFLMQAMPGDITMMYLSNPKIPQAAREELRKQLGLDQSLFMQYFSYMKNFFRGELGVSFSPISKTGMGYPHGETAKNVCPISYSECIVLLYWFLSWAK